MNTRLINLCSFAAQNPSDLNLLEILRESRSKLGCKFITVWAEIGTGTAEADLVIVSTYPQTWITHYAVSGYSRIDPLLRKCLGGTSIYTPTDDPDLSDEEKEMFDAAQQHGIGGFFVSIPSFFESSRSVTTLAFEDRKTCEDIPRSVLREHAHSLLIRTMEKTVGFQPEKLVTKREAECLQWAAVGKTDDEIAEILGIKRWTVVAHLQSCKSKLGAVNRAAAVTRALQLGVIFFT